MSDLKIYWFTDDRPFFPIDPYIEKIRGSCIWSSPWYPFFLSDKIGHIGDILL